jgi:hypothetical protein
MSAVEQKKERIRVALQELGDPTSKMSTWEAMETLRTEACLDFFDLDGSIGDFVGDDDFKEEIFSARVIQVLITVAQDKKAYPPKFYRSGIILLYFFCSDNTEFATTFAANGGVEFLLETLEAFSSNQPLLDTCFLVYRAVIESLDENESAAFAGMTLGKLVDVFELNYETADEEFYKNYCVALGNNLKPGLDLVVNKKYFPRIASQAWHGIMKYKNDEVVQYFGRRLLNYIVGPETAEEMIDHAEMHHWEDEECGGCA